MLDGHVKWLRPEQVSGGAAAGSATAVEIYNANDNAGYAAGTGSLQHANGTQAAVTFSPI